MASLTETLLSDPSRAADQSALDQLMGLAFSTAVYAQDPSRQGALQDHLGGGGTARSVDDEFRTLSERQRSSGLSLDGIDIEEALFRRAEGVTLHWDLRRSGATAVRAGEEAVELDAAPAGLLSGLSSWSRLRAEEATWAALLVHRGMAWFADHDPGRTLPGGTSVAERPALVRTFQAVPLFARDEVARPRALEFMPRVGEASGLRLRGFDFRGHRRGRDVGGEALIGGYDHGEAMRRLLPELRGSKSVVELIEELPPRLREAGGRCLEAMSRSNLLESPDGAGSPWTDGKQVGASATWLGHASVLIRTDDSMIWVDPTTSSYQHQAEPGEAQPPCRRSRPALAAILVTHGDNDHLHPATLCEVSPETPVLIPSMEGAGQWQVDLDGLLRTLHFDDVRQVADWESMSIGSAVVTAVPFEGEDWGLHQCSCTWLIEGAERRIYLSADSAGMQVHGARIRGESGVDLAFLGVSGNSEPHVMTPGFGYGDFYGDWVPNQRRGRFIRHTDGPSQAAEMARLIGARRVFGYAAGGVPWMPTTYSDEGDHSELAAVLEEDPGGVRPVDLLLGEPYEL